MVKYRKNTKSYKKQRKTRKSGNGGGFFRQVFGGDIEEGTKDEEDKQGGIMGTLNKTKEGASGILGNMLGKNVHKEDEANEKADMVEKGNAGVSYMAGGKKKKGCGCSGGMNGGKKRKSHKSRKGRKTRKGGKSRKGRKSKKSKKSKKSRK